MTKVFYLDSNLEIQETSYKDFVEEFGADETTTPHGVANREFVEEYELTVSVDEDGYKEFDYSGEPVIFEDDFSDLEPGKHIIYAFSTWGVGGNNYKAIQLFRTRKEAEAELFRSKEVYLGNADNVPQMYETQEEAEADRKEILE